MREGIDRFASTSSTSPRTAGRIPSLDSESKGLTLIRPGPGTVFRTGTERQSQPRVTSHSRRSCSQEVRRGRQLQRPILAQE